MFNPYLPVILQLLHGTVHLSHYVVGLTLAADSEVPLGLLYSQWFGPGGVEGIQGAPGFRAVSQKWGHPFRVGLHPWRQGHALIDEGACRGAGGQVELTGLVHDATVVNDEMVGHGQLVLRVSTVQAAKNLGLCALKLLTYLSNSLLVHHCAVIRGVLREQVAWQILLEPLMLSEREKVVQHNCKFL